MWQCEEAVCRGGRPGSDLSFHSLPLSRSRSLLAIKSHSTHLLRNMAVKEAARSCAGGEGGQWDHVREGRSRAKVVWKRRGRERETARVCERLRERELPLGAVVKLNGDCRSATRERDLGRF